MFSLNTFNGFGCGKTRVYKIKLTGDEKALLLKTIREKSNQYTRRIDYSEKDFLLNLHFYLKHSNGTY